MLLVAYAIFWLCAPVLFVLWLKQPPRQTGKHRGTPGQLMLQEAQRAERMTEWAHGVLTEV